MIPSAFPNPDGPVVQMGTVKAAGLGVLLAQERRAAEAQQAEPVIQSLATHVRKCWGVARDAKQMGVEKRMLEAVRARRGEYDPLKLAQIRSQGGSEIYAMLTSVKCRSASSWIRDIMLGTGSEKPWGIRPTPLPDLPADVNEIIVQAASMHVQEAMALGLIITPQQLMEAMAFARDEAKHLLFEDARKKAERMETKMEDQLLEGGFLSALHDFIDDITTFPAAFLKGPVIRKKPKLKWAEGANGFEPQVEEYLCVEWERVSPFDIYPSPQATCVQEGFLIERHKLSRRDLNELIGVEGYNEASIKTVLDEYARGGLREWLTNDSERAEAEGHSIRSHENPEGLIDAIQFWGSVPGSLLVEWGMDAAEVPDPTKEYEVECWLIGNWVIKAVLNYDPLARKPYYKASYEEVPGSFWGNSVVDLVADPQQVVNAASRAMVNNMGIASGPQVMVNVSRLPAGESITTMYPWKIWQVKDDPLTMSAGQKPIDFFQPTSNVQELVQVFEKFTEMADEYSGIPRYLSGETTGGAGRTASGLSMLINNAGKSIKQVIANIDMNIMRPAIERLYYHNMRYAEDPELKGDVQIVAQGAAALVAKESAQIRRNEFLAATANPIDMQIVGLEGRAALLRETAKNLDMDADKVVPPVEVLRKRQAMMAMQQQQMLAAGPQDEASNNQQQLMDGAPVTDNFGPPKQNP